MQLAIWIVTRPMFLPARRHAAAITWAGFANVCRLFVSVRLSGGLTLIHCRHIVEIPGILFHG